jgi:hypothetical protein
MKYLTAEEFFGETAN